jgi:hypothetical protein
VKAASRLGMACPCYIRDRLYNKSIKVKARSIWLLPASALGTKGFRTDASGAKRPGSGFDEAGR